ncbi:MAG: hypothetical protein E7599_04745 [Ruminococcaceae bacterium]|nr:hypothetical protein [Oscillospiraceae bacterium]
MKEDILLVREGNVNTFSFILNTDGLIPAEDAGGWYLWDGIDVSQQIRLGQVISYDANGALKSRAPYFIKKPVRTVILTG